MSRNSSCRVLAGQVAVVRKLVPVAPHLPSSASIRARISGSAGADSGVCRSNCEQVPRYRHRGRSLARGSRLAGRGHAKPNLSRARIGGAAADASLAAGPGWRKHDHGGRVAGRSRGLASPRRARLMSVRMRVDGAQPLPAGVGRGSPDVPRAAKGGAARGFPSCQASCHNNSWLARTIFADMTPSQMGSDGRCRKL